MSDIADARGAVRRADDATPAPRALIDYDFQSVLARAAEAAAGAVADGRADRRRRAGARVLPRSISSSAPTASIVTSDSEIVVQPLETSVVRSVAVKMGQQVKAGEVLATLDPTFTGADEDELSAKSRNLSAAYDRIDSRARRRRLRPGQRQRRRAHAARHLSQTARRIRRKDRRLRSARSSSTRPISRPTRPRRKASRSRSGWRAGGGHLPAAGRQGPRLEARS